MRQNQLAIIGADFFDVLDQLIEMYVRVALISLRCCAITLSDVVY